MRGCFPLRAIVFFLQRMLPGERLATSMLNWIASGFRVDEGGTDAVIYHAPCSDFFKTDNLQHHPVSRCRLICTCSLYSSDARGTPDLAKTRQPCRNTLIRSRRLSPMKVIAVIIDPAQVPRILMNLSGFGRQLSLR